LGSMKFQNIPNSCSKYNINVFFGKGFYSQSIFCNGLSISNGIGMLNLFSNHNPRKNKPRRGPRWCGHRLNQSGR
jgi:hypothetical protein